MGASPGQGAPLGGLGRPRGWSELGRRRRAAAVGARDTAARLLRWTIGDEEGSVSCARTGEADGRVSVGGGEL